MTFNSRISHPALDIKGGHSAHHSYAVADEPDSARTMAHKSNPPAHAVATNGAWVWYKINDGAEQVGLMSTHARADMVDGIIPQTSPLGVALTGLRAGMRAPLPCADGSVTSVTVLRVELPD